MCRILSHRNPNSQVRSGFRNFEVTPSVFPQVTVIIQTRSLLSAVPLNARRFREANGSGTVCNLSHGKPSLPPAVVRERAVVVHLARSGSAIYHGLNKRGK